MFKRHITSVIIVALMGCVAGACSTSNWTPVAPETAHSTLKVGDTVRVTDNDGALHEFEVYDVTEHGELIGDDLVMALESLSLIELRQDHGGDLAYDIAPLVIGFAAILGVLVLSAGGAALIF